MAMNSRGDSGNVLAAVGIPEPDVEVAKADLVGRIHRLLDQRPMSPERAGALLNVSAAELPALLQGRLATCSLDQLLRLLAWLGDDVEILIRPRVRRTSRGIVRVFQAAGIDRVDFVERGLQTPTSPHASVLPRMPLREGATKRVPQKQPRADDKQLLDKWQVEEMTSLDITTIYRKMKAGSIPQPVKVGRRRVAWRRSDIAEWQAGLEVGTRR